MNNLKIIHHKADGDKAYESVAEKKKELRAYMKKRRANNENRDVKETLLLENFLSGLKNELKGKDNFFVYLSYSSEAPTDLLIERLIELGKKVFCPRIDGDEMVAVPYGEDFTLSSLGIREPIGQAFTGRIDVAVTPLFAVDKQGNRLGYGKGYYDKFFNKQQEILKIGYCFDFQLLTETPHTATDVPMDIVVTDKRVVTVKNERENQK